MLAQAFEKSGRGRDAAHVAGNGLDNHTRNAIAGLPERGFDAIQIVERQSDGGVGKRLGDTRGIGKTQRRDAGAGLHQQRIHMAVIAAFELYG